MEKNIKLGAVEVLTTSGNVKIPNESGKKIILYFYPKDATPGCSIEGQDFRDNHEFFENKDILVYGVSKDSIESHDKFKKNQGFPFDLIADTDGGLCDTFGVWQERKTMNGKKFGIVRTTFLISSDGKILKEWFVGKVGGHVTAVMDYIETN